MKKIDGRRKGNRKKKVGKRGEGDVNKMESGRNVIENGGKRMESEHNRRESE